MTSPRRLLLGAQGSPLIATVYHSAPLVTKVGAVTCDGSDGRPAGVYIIFNGPVIHPPCSLCDLLFSVLPRTVHHPDRAEEPCTVKDKPAVPAHSLALLSLMCCVAPVLCFSFSQRSNCYGCSTWDPVLVKSKVSVASSETMLSTVS